MQKNTSVTLGEHFERFVASKVMEGRFGSVSEAIRAGLRLLEEQELKLATLRIALVDGEQSGFVENYALPDVLATLDRENPA